MENGEKQNSKMNSPDPSKRSQGCEYFMKFIYQLLYPGFGFWSVLVFCLSFVERANFFLLKLSLQHQKLEGGREGGGGF